MTPSFKNGMMQCVEKIRSHIELFSNAGYSKEDLVASKTMPSLKEGVLHFVVTRLSS